MPLVFKAKGTARTNTTQLVPWSSEVIHYFDSPRVRFFHRFTAWTLWA